MRSKEEEVGNDTVAVSEAISYVLIFGLISIGAGLIYLQATPALDGVEKKQIDENSERAMLLIQERLDEMVNQNAPLREVTVSGRDLDAGIGGFGETRVNITWVQDSGEVSSFAANATPVYLRTSSRTIAYENGGILVGQQGNDESWAMRTEPSWAISTNASDYPRSVFVKTYSTVGGGRTVGDGRIAFIFESISRRTENVRDINSLNITVKSRRWEAWERYFDGINNSINGSQVLTDASADRTKLRISEFANSSSVSYDEETIRARIESRSVSQG